ncbi:hypothetical protein ACIRG5_06335 [Lentzea sp. NPDC102401]|uniref:hypothetical protein n=1 Tax=Lentzea sp. NPDC102401 TaxID=3364128 RepID=UPI00382DE366
MSVAVAVIALIIGYAAWQYPRSPQGGPNAPMQSQGTSVTPAMISSPAVTSSVVSPAREPTSSGPTPVVTHVRSAGSPLYLNVDGSYSQYKVRPDQYRADHDIKFTVHVTDDMGDVSSGCYATITALQNGSVIKKDESGCYPSYGWINLHAGAYTIQFDVITDWGASGRKSVEVQMVP